MTVTVTIDAETARICLPALKRAITDAEFRANAAGNDAAFHREENRACALDCLVTALERALPSAKPALGQVTPSQPDPSRLCCDNCAVGLTPATANFVESLSRDCASANAGESGTLCCTCLERDRLACDAA